MKGLKSVGFNADIKRSKKDCIFFGNRYLSHLITQKCSPFHPRQLEIVENPEYDRISLLAPRGHAKSTWLSIIYPIWKIVTNRNIKIIIVSDTGDQAEMFLRAIKDEFETNVSLIEDFGEFYRKPKSGSPNVWKTSDITVLRTSRAKEPTIICGGSGKRIVGRRADLIIVDDPLNDENTDSERQRRKTLRWFRKTLTPILNPDGGKIVVIGTRKHPEDLHTELVRNIRYHKFVFPAIDKDEQGNEKPLWPDRWPLKKLMKVKEEIGSLVFAQEYQNEPIREGTTYFRRAWIERCFVYSAKMPESYSGEMSVYTGWDLAIVADKEHAETHDTDYTEGITIALGEDGTRYIIGIFRERGMTPGQILEAVKTRARLFNPILVTLENNLFQSFIEQQLISTTDLPIAGHTTGREKTDVFKEVPSLSVLFENGKYNLPMGDEQSSGLVNTLANELVGLGVETHDDMVMALWTTECRIRRYTDNETCLEVVDDPTF